MNNNSSNTNPWAFKLLKWFASGFAIVIGLFVLVIMLLFTVFRAPFAEWLDVNVGSAARKYTIPLEPGKLPARSAAPLWTAGDYSYMTPERTEILEAYRGTGIPKFALQGKSSTSRNLIAKLAVGHHVEEINTYIQGLTPWGPSGSSYDLGKIKRLGDYDFAEAGLTTILCLFGDRPDILYPVTAEHLVNVLLIETGGTPRPAVPGSLGMIEDTENHILMKEGTRYLRNQWLFTHGHPKAKYDNTKNGLEEWLLEFMQEIIDEGVYEFHSKPYLGYTFSGLVNLQAFPLSDELRARTRHVMDMINYQCALGSFQGRRVAPFRRQMGKAKGTTLIHDASPDFMRVWEGDGTPIAESSVALNRPKKNSKAVLAAALPYTLPKDVQDWSLVKAHEYFVTIGRGPMASPEIHSAGPNYMLSAGGVHRGYRSMIVARPTTLLLPDKAHDLKGAFHITGKGDWKTWNNTGVYKRFAVGNSSVHIPKQYTPAAELDGWKIFTPESAPGLSVVTYDAPGEKFGLIALFPNEARAPDALLNTISQSNRDIAKASTFHWPKETSNAAGSISFEVNAPKGTWVIKEVTGDEDIPDRDYDHWPHVGGEPPEIRFDERS
jgi:hypothetical protein